MGERSLVVHQDALAEIENAMGAASDAIREQVTSLLDDVNAHTPAWLPQTPSRVAQQDHERRLREGLVRLTEALEQVRAAVADHRERSRETEVENVAVIG